MSEFRLDGADVYERNEARTEAYAQALWTPAGQPVLDYLHGRGLEDRTIRHFRLGAVVEPFPEDRPATGRLSIPALQSRGPGAVRFRAIQPEATPKYWAPAGTGVKAFNALELLYPKQAIAITEGEIDCMTLWQCGVPAVGIMGVNSWGVHYRYLFDGYQHVYIAGDNDDKGNGRDFMEKVAAQVPGPRAVMMPDGHDINSYYNAFGRESLLSHLDWEE